jgi:ubiquinone biosynthesis monooxygenase Coq7
VYFQLGFKGNPAYNTRMRQYSFLDKAIIQIHKGLSAVASDLQGERKSPAIDIPDVELQEAERAKSAGCMRVNHSGEVCAQAL